MDEREDICFDSLLDSCSPKQTAVRACCTSDYSAVTFPSSLLLPLSPLSSHNWPLSFHSPLLFLPPTPAFLPTHPQHTRPTTGWEVLEPAGQEQRGGQALARRPAAEGEPDLGARRLPGAGERRPSPGGGRHEERAGPLQEHHQQVRESARRLVRRRRKKKTMMKDAGVGGEEI